MEDTIYNYLNKAKNIQVQKFFAEETFDTLDIIR